MSKCCQTPVSTTRANIHATATTHGNHTHIFIRDTRYDGLTVKPSPSEICLRHVFSYYRQGPSIFAMFGLPALLRSRALQPMYIPSLPLQIPHYKGRHMANSEVSMGDTWQTHGKLEDNDWINILKLIKVNVHLL